MTAAQINQKIVDAAKRRAKRNGVDEGDLRKTWVTMHDEKVRPAHAIMDGRSLPLDQDFVVAGHRMSMPGDLRAPDDLICGCRCILRIAPYSLRAAANDTHDDAVYPLRGDEIGDTDMDDTTEPAEVEQAASTLWHGVLAPEGVWSGDKRQFRLNSLDHRDLPLPLMYQDATSEGHDGAVRVANIMEIARAESHDGTAQMRAWGHFDTSDNAKEAARQIDEQMLRGVSVDVDMAEFVFEDSEGNEVTFDDVPLDEDPGMAITGGRISGATLVSIPAFQEAFVALGPPPAEWGFSPDAIAAAATFESVSDKPWSDFTQADYSDEQWQRACVLDRGDGEGKQRYGLPIREPSGTLNRNGVHAAAARFNQVQASSEAKSKAKNALRRAYGTLGEEPPDVIASSLQASAVAAPPSSWFTDPHLDGPTPLTILADGRVFGHLATFGTCHIAYEGHCVTPPQSATNYAYFHTGEVLCADGVSMPVGHITIGTGHAAARLGPRPAAEHYDNTGAVAADVAAGDDEHGIWIAGALRPGQFAATLRAAALSGDWRRIGGNLELVAALAVNVPGFPIPRTRAAMVAGAQTALVASGVVTPALDRRGPAVQAEAVTAAAIAREMRAIDRRRSRAEQVAARIGRDKASRRQAALAMRGGQ